jgi:uncharacterized protein YqfA (UPF0365 family)
MTGYLIVMVATLGFTLLLFFWSTIMYKFKADKLGLNISWEQALGQRLCRTMTADILEAASLAKKENLDVDVVKLETHKIAGGEPLKVVKEIIENKRRGQIVEFNQAAALDLAGKALK